MKQIVTSIFIFVLVLGLSLQAQAAPISVYFDVANAPDHASSLNPNYVGISNSLVTATPLLAHGVNPSYDSDIGGPGDFIFTGWGVKEQPINWSKYIEFNVTAMVPISFENLKYSFFGGLWSNMGGTRGVIVKTSRDGFVANETTIRSGGWNVLLTTPYITDSPNDFVDDLSNLGVLNTGQTMSFRFYAVYADYGSIPGGFWNKSPNDYNPTLEIAAAVPEPASLLLLGTGLVGIVALRRRKRP